METTIEDIKVMCVKSENGPVGAQTAFNKLESKFLSLRGRKFYGVFQGGVYYACTAITEGEDAVTLGFDTMIIPGGKYARTKIMGWMSKTYLIGSTFDTMAKQYEIDTARPSIEFYRSQKELILLLPIK